MKIKIGTTLESELYDRVVERAKARGIRVNEVFEEALTAYLSDDTSMANYVAESFGTYRVSSDALEEIIDCDIYDT